MDWAKVVEGNMLKQLWINPQEIPTNSLIQKYLIIVCRRIMGAGNTLTIEKGSNRPEILEVMVNHKGSSRVDGGTVPIIAVGQKKRPQPQSRPK